MITSTHGIGIDFGSSTVLVAMCKNGTADVIPNEMGNRATQNCLSYALVQDGENPEAPKVQDVQLGDPAYNQKERNLAGRVYSLFTGGRPRP